MWTNGVDLIFSPGGQLAVQQWQPLHRMGLWSHPFSETNLTATADAVVAEATADAAVVEATADAAVAKATVDAPVAEVTEVSLKVKGNRCY